MESTTAKIHSGTVSLKPQHPSAYVPIAPRLHVYRAELFGLEAEAQRLDLPIANQLFKGPRQRLSRSTAATTEPLNGSAPLNGSGQVLSPSGSSRHSDSKRLILLLVDQRTTMLFGSRRRAKSVVAAQAAALLAWRATALRLQLGAMIFNDRTIEEIGPRRSRLRARLILHVLLTLNQALSPYDMEQSDLRVLNEALRRTASPSLTGSGIFLITDGSGWNKETTALIERIAKRNKVVVFLVYDRRQIDFKSPYFVGANPAGKERKIESEDNQDPASGRSLREMASHIVCGSLPRGVSIIPIHTHADVVSQLSRIWRQPSSKSETARQMDTSHPNEA